MAYMKTKKKENDSATAYNLGRAAFDKGKNLTANPFPAGSMSNSHWRSGWTEKEDESFKKAK